MIRRLALIFLFLAAAGLIAIVPWLSSAQASPVDQVFREGLSAYNSGNYQKAMQIWMPLAQGEDAPAQAGIGFMFHKGLGVATDNGKAAYWLRKAAEHGQPEGQFMLGTLYFYGAGVERTMSKPMPGATLHRTAAMPTPRPA